VSVLVALKLIFFEAKYKTRGNGSPTRDLMVIESPYHWANNSVVFLIGVIFS
jgi:hypothetical protein